MMKRKCPGCKKESCDYCSLRKTTGLHTIKKNEAEFPISFRVTEKQGWGVAFDIGTTTLAGMLYRLEDGKQIAVSARTNPQVKYGADVISRISYSMENEEQQKKLHTILIEVLDEMIEEMTQEALNAEGILLMEADTEILEIKVVGNTAMCQIFLNYPLHNLSQAPFVPAYQGAEVKSGREISLKSAEDAVITVLPCIGGFAGADALAVYTYLMAREAKRPVMAVDIGTNGEIILVGKDKAYVCSTAAGPALEGAAVSRGMRAFDGAIDTVFMKENDIVCHVIGGKEPRGICGSGLIDALAVLSDQGVIDETGCLLTQEEAEEAGVLQKLCGRIRGENAHAGVLLTDSRNSIILTVQDIRQLQLAKGAIRAGIQVLLDKEGIKEEELEVLYLAGAFGSYIDSLHAVQIGLLPPAAQIVHVGNCAGTGAAMALLSSEVMKNIELEAEHIVHVELAEEEAFEKYFLKYLNLQF